MSNPKKSDKFSTAFESIDSENRTSKEAGLTHEESIAFEKKECSTALNSALTKTDDDNCYGVIRKHIDLLLSALNAVDAMYA